MRQNSLQSVYEGWDGYNLSLVRAITPLTSEQLAFRLAPEIRSVGELAAHISLGRVDWFRRMPAPGSAELDLRLSSIRRGGDLSPDTGIADDAGELVRLLDLTWNMIAETLAAWTVEDLALTYHHSYQGKTYAVSRQWTIWRIMAHDIHHGGQLSMLLGAQGIMPLELTLLGGHLTEPPVVD
ncbi:MAG: DinB family protein [Chloroflexi bacterium]|nr:DinB family protein [Chloroflexota bacterium]